jgi:hypothetical protein
MRAEYGLCESETTFVYVGDLRKARGEYPSSLATERGPVAICLLHPSGRLTTSLLQVQLSPHDSVSSRSRKIDNWDRWVH